MKRNKIIFHLNGSKLNQPGSQELKKSMLLNNYSKKGVVDLFMPIPYWTDVGISIFNTFAITNTFSIQIYFTI